MASDGAKAIKMHTKLHYLPLPSGYIGFLAGILLVLIILFQLEVLRTVYAKLGVGWRSILFLLFASLLGGYINIPIAQLPDQLVVIGVPAENMFGMPYMAPEHVDWPGTIIAVNVGGALIPALLSLYLLVRNALWAPGLVGTACVAIICYWLAHPIPGIGITIPTILPGLAAAIAAVLLARWRTAAVAYISGTLGCLIGADLLNLGTLQGLGAPIASIGGAGTFDGVFLTGVIAVLIASLPIWA